MAKELRTQWHPAFCSAVKLELKEDEAYLDYYNEYNLNSKPLEIDLLVIKKLKEIELQNDIGKIFRKHNILEYKSPKASLNANTFLKVVAYAYLYKISEKNIDDIRLDEITLTFIREGKPRKLFRWFAKNGYQVTEKYKGIYHIIKEQMFPIQVIVSKELSKENQKWLAYLSRDLSLDEAKKVVEQLDSLTGNSDRMLGDSVLQVVLKGNKKVFTKIKEEDEKMCEALRELFADELKEAIEKERAIFEKERKEAVKQKQKDMISHAIKLGSNIKDISSIMGIPLEEVELVEKELLQLA